MIFTLLITILVEGGVVLVYATLRKTPAGTLLRASLMVNVLTQIMLWIALRIFFQHYLITLIVAEFLIWFVESVLMYYFARGQLSPANAIVLSLCMNGASFGVGWFLPV